MTEPRKASEVILSLENKVDILLGLVRSLDLNIKVLSNKLNQLLAKQETSSPKIVVEAANVALPALSSFNSERDVLISPEDSSLMEVNPKGFRRTSRPETFSGDDIYLNRESKEAPKAEAIVPRPKDKPSNTPKSVPNTSPPASIVATMQRIIRGGKSVFMADVEITNMTTGKVEKSRTNAVGKWNAPLQPGGYRIVVRKQEIASKEKFEIEQNIQIDGKQSPLELPPLIVK